MSSQLTQREREVMLLRAEGFYTNEIAQKINRSVRTIEMHLYNVYKKTGVRNLAELVNYVNKNMKD